ncbi:hypothetical protein Goari_000184, partial [Gossypium aridum]|nr:hypothetical protein [Gossypium aridum]
FALYSPALLDKPFAYSVLNSCFNLNLSDTEYVIRHLDHFPHVAFFCTIIFNTCYRLFHRTMIQNMIKEGKIVPSEVTIKLLQKAMLESGNDKFLIDGFPRNEENRAAFEAVTKIEPEFVLFFNCPEEEMEKRLLSRNQGREDDNIETIRKRFKVFLDSSLPVIEYYKAKGKVREIEAAKPVGEVFEAVKVVFTPKAEKVKNSIGLSLFTLETNRASSTHGRYALHIQVVA